MFALTSSTTRRAAFGALLLLTAAACGKDSSTESKDAAVTGSYALQQVDGHALPATLYNGPITLAPAPGAGTSTRCATPRTPRRAQAGHR